jgi:hypothetical protein
MISISGIYIPTCICDISDVLGIRVYVVVREIIASGGVKLNDESEPGIGSQYQMRRRVGRIHMSDSSLQLPDLRVGKSQLGQETCDGSLFEADG